MRRKQITQGNLAQQLFNAPQSVDLYSIARDYLARGWSVIPLKQDKTSAVGWTQFQRTAANELTLAKWFSDGDYAALGIVCGRVSRLGVLDFDNLERAAAFRQQLPHLAETREIRTGLRRAPHFYYTLSDDLLNAKTTHMNGVGDFQANGAYVVAYPSVIDGGMWELVSDAPLYTLTKHDHAAILEFLGIRKSQSSTPLVVLPKPITTDDLLAAYAKQRETKGRNDSAFHAALSVSKMLPMEETIAALAGAFIADPPPFGHAQQDERARYKELAATVRSAYRVDYNPTAADYQAQNEGLPNSLREHLLQNKGVHTARVLDMLLMTGLRPGQRFTERDAIACGKYHGIGDKTVSNALKWIEARAGEITVLRTGAGVAIAPGASLSANRFPSELPIYTWADTNTMYCMWQNGRKSPTGRPSKVFTVPDPRDLCTVLHIGISQGDKLQLVDLKSAAAYRAGITRALVARRENKPMSRQWQAKLLGVSVRTAYSYDDDAGIEAIPDSLVTPIHWHNLDRVPIKPDYDKRVGYYLQIDGKKHVARRFIAADALQAGKVVEYVERRANKYRLKRG